MRASLLVAVLGLAAVACSSSKTTPHPNSTVEGSVAMSTFALGAPSAVDAVDETGARSHGALGANGAFKLTMTKGHVYRLVAVTPKGEEPLVFPRNGGRLDTTFRISSGAALVTLGTVRHFDKAPATGFTASDDGKTACESGDQGADDHGDGECENGKDAKTGQPCADDGEGAAADPAQPMAVAEKSPPNDVSGCEDGTNDGEENDD